MRPISNIMDKNVHELKHGQPSEDHTVNPAISQIVDQLFAFFFAICRGFEKQYQDPKRLNAEKTQWRAAFEDVGINQRSQIEWGIKRTRLESPINTPTIKQFLDWCTPEPSMLNLPTMDMAFDEACKNSHPAATKTWTHDVVYYAWSQTGSYNLSNKPSALIRPKFDEHYTDAIKLHIQGKILRQIDKPCAEHSPSVNTEKMSREQAMALMKQKRGIR